MAELVPPPPPWSLSDDEDICAICQMPMKDGEAKRAPMSCGRHYFHEGCLCSHYETSRQGGCPVCRKGQRDSELYIDSIDDENPEPSYWAPRVPWVPFPMVRRAIKANPRTRNMAKTLTKNEKELKNMRRIHKAKEEELLALESEAEDKIASFEREAWKRHAKKNETLIEEVNKLLEEENKLHRRVISSKQRMRAKYARG
jgi:hypothetical protein